MPRRDGRSELTAGSRSRRTSCGCPNQTTSSVHKEAAALLYGVRTRRSSSRPATTYTSCSDMKSNVVRTFAVLTVLALVLLFSLSSCGADVFHRLQTMTSLLGTFVLFPLSKVREVIVDDARMQQRQPEAQHRIPKLIQQVKLGGLTMRSTWTAARQSCLDLHPDWTFRLWEDGEADAFVQSHYPHLFEMYRAYPLEIQRSNVLRYLLLDQFGGVYLDLDLRCRVPLDPLLNETFLTPPANPSGVNNAFIASTAKHPFWTHLQAALPLYNLEWFGSPYVSNMMSTGCHFFSTMHRTFEGQSSMGVMDQANKLNGHVTTPLFEHLGASSWHKGDAKAILRLGGYIESLKHHPALGLTGFLTSLVLLGSAIRLALRRRSARRKGYSDIEASKAFLVHHS